MRSVVCFFLFWIALPVASHGQYKIQSSPLDGIPSLYSDTSEALTTGSSFSNFYGWRMERAETGENYGVWAACQEGSIFNPIMDGISEFRCKDFADQVDSRFASNDVVSTESLESLGVDAETGRFLLRLTLTWSTTANPNFAQWDSFEFDLRDPLDLDGDGETGTGPDGVFGTVDDVEEPDGILDTGDGILDSPMPLDPPGLIQYFFCDDEGDCGSPGNVVLNPVGPQFSIGSSLPIQFDKEAGEIVIRAIYWILEDFDGGLADLDRDGRPGIGDFTGDFDSNGDGLPDSIRTDLLAPPSDCPLGDGCWNGTYSLSFIQDENPLTTDELMSGSLRRIGFVFDILSDIEIEFGPLRGDVNFDGAIDLLDIAPFIERVVNGGYLFEADINGDDVVNLLDVSGFVDKLING